MNLQVFYHQSLDVMRISFCAVGLVALAACGGGGGGGGSSSGGDAGSGGGFAAPTPPAIVADASTFETTEFNAAPGLAQIKAQYAYERGATGDGVTVAVVDDGVNFSHPDLTGKSVSSATVSEAGGVQAPSYLSGGRGTAIAGVIAAAKNDTDIQGVAYDANIMSVRIDDGSGVWLEQDIVAGINYAIDSGANVINLSFGLASTSQGFKDALQRAKDAGIAVVAATGNGGASQPLEPAALSRDSSFGSNLIAVGGVDTSNVITSTSNQCGNVATRCVVAPGDDVVTLDASGTGTITITTPTTALAAAYVSGAIAVLMDAFPTLTTDQVIAILLQNTQDLGAAGVDTVYGQGLIDLQKAIAPSGTIMIPTSTSISGASVALTDTSVTLGSSFGDALTTQASFLSEVVGLDVYRRAYKFNLSRNVSRTSRTFEWGSRLSPDETRMVDLDGPDGLSLGVVARKSELLRGEGAPWVYFADDRAEGEYPPIDGLTAKWNLSAETQLSLVHGLTADRLPADHVTAEANGLFLDGRENFSPYLGLMSKGTGAAARHDLSRNTSVRFGWFGGDGSNAGTDEAASLASGASNMVFGGMSHRFGDGVRLGLRYSQVEEDSRFLATRTTGAFGDGTGARSSFLTASLSAPILKGTYFVAGYTEAKSRIEQDGFSLLSDWSDVHANAFAAGVVTRDPFGAGGSLGLMAGQPLRVYSATASLTLPTSVNPDGTINVRSERVDMTPSGRELNLQLAYQAGLFEGGLVQGWVIGRLQPGHDRDAPPDYGAGVKLSFGF